MKRILGILLCSLLVCTSLFSCKKTVIGEDLKYRQDDSDENATIETLNMYIIVGENTNTQVLKTVSSQINVLLKEKYHTQLNIVYCTADEYYTKVMASLADGVLEPERADIVLINDIQLFNELYQGGKLACLTDFYKDKNFERLNAIIEDNLLSSSVIVELDPKQENEDLKYVENYYTVPNNHLIGEYKYIVIDKIQATYKRNFSSHKIAAMNNENDLAIYVEALRTDSSDSGVYASLVKGGYEDKLLLEYGCTSLDELKILIGDYFDANVADKELSADALAVAREAYINENSQIIEVKGEFCVKAPIKKVNYVNVASYPNATANEAFSSAYAIIKNLNDTPEIRGDKEFEDECAIIDKHYSKCMDIIFALNTDAELRNMLQYGYVGTNYKFILDNKNQPTDYIKLEQNNTEKIYNMNLDYTGNPYIAYYCESIGWNSTVHDNILKQNANSYTLQEKLQFEFAALSVEDIDFGFEKDIILPSNGVTFGDVKIVWTLASENTEGDVNVKKTGDIFNDQIIYIDCTVDGEPLDTQLIATLTCTDDSGETVSIVKTFDILVEYIPE